MLALFLAPAAWAGKSASSVVCMANGQALAINNDKVLQWKASTPNQYHDRGHVSGPVMRVFDDRPGHTHFEIQIGKSPNDVLEVVYNTEFGQLPDIQVGMQVEACGDYITATAKAGPYPPSPSGAIIHWVHTNPSGRGHDSGFLIIDGVLYGQENPPADHRRHFDEQQANFFNSEQP